VIDRLRRRSADGADRLFPNECQQELGECGVPIHGIGGGIDLDGDPISEIGLATDYPHVAASRCCRLIASIKSSA
jgi:hypothetical protein